MRSSASGCRRRSCVFTQRLVILLGTYALINCLIWFLFTKDILKSGAHATDLIRLSYLVKINQPRVDGSDLPRRHINLKDFRGGPVDMVTFGDSFSQGGGGGWNRYYQDYIATLNRFNVVNVSSKVDMARLGFFTPVDSLALFCNSGLLDRLKPRYVLLESAERYATDRLVNNFNFTKSGAPGEILEDYRHLKPVDLLKGQSSTVINSGNIKFLVNNVRDLFPVERINNDIYKAKLIKPLFSGRYSDRLYYYRPEYDQGLSDTADLIYQMNENLNYIADRLAAKGIKLIFMPAVSRTNLYGAYMLPPLPTGLFFEELRRLDKRYIFIDTKALLVGHLDRGEKDIFFADDNHWSWKASKIIFESVTFD